MCQCDISLSRCKPSPTSSLNDTFLCRVAILPPSPSTLTATFLCHIVNVTRKYLIEAIPQLKLIIPNSHTAIG